MLGYKIEKENKFMIISNVKSRGSLDAVQPVQPVARAENDLQRKPDTAEISELAQLLSRKAEIEGQ